MTVVLRAVGEGSADEDVREPVRIEVAAGEGEPVRQEVARVGAKDDGVGPLLGEVIVAGDGEGGDIGGDGGSESDLGG